MVESEKHAPVTIQELLVRALRKTDALAKLLIQKGIITKDEFMTKLSEERAIFQKMFNPTQHRGDIDLPKAWVHSFGRAGEHRLRSAQRLGSEKPDAL